MFVTKCCKNSIRRSLFILPELLAQEIEWGRDPFINYTLFLFLGNMYIGGIELPVALTAHVRAGAYFGGAIGPCPLPLWVARII